MPYHRCLPLTSLTLSLHSPSPLEISLGTNMASSRSLPPCAKDSGYTAFSSESASSSSGKLAFQNSPGLSAEGCPGSHSCQSVYLPSGRAKISSMFSHLHHQTLYSTQHRIEDSSWSSAKFWNTCTVECLIGILQKNLSSHDTIKVPSYTQKCIQKTRGLSRHKDVRLHRTGMNCQLTCAMYLTVATQPRSLC